jgi:hypothetical protein
MKKLIIKKEELKESKKLDFILNDLNKSNNFLFIHEKFKDEKDYSFSDKIENLEELFQSKNQDESKKRSLDDFQLLMIHRESRKIYYLMIHDMKNDEIFFLSKNDSIMKNKLFLLKLIQFFEKSEMKIHYIKNDRKNQSSEIIKKDDKEYSSKLIKYSMI